MAEPYSVERLRALHLVWLHGSLTAAAHRLHVTTSAVSQQLTKLERETGTALITPAGRGVRLTAAGDLLARRAGRIVDELVAARRDLESLAGEAAGPVHVGAIPSAVHTFITTALTSLVTRFPNVEPHLSEVEPEQGLPMLDQGELEMVVVESWENMPLGRTSDTTWSPLINDTACVVLPHDHPRADADAISIDELDKETWVGWSHGSRANAWMRQTLRERGLEPDVHYTVTGYSTQFAVVAGLHAAALLPTMAAAVAPSSVRALPLRPVLHRTLYAVYSHQEPRPALAECLASLGAAAASWQPHAPTPSDPGSRGEARDPSEAVDPL